MEQETREVFARVADCEGPPLGFSADGIAELGRRQVRGRRLWSAAGGAVSVLAVGAVALPLALAGAGGSSAASGGSAADASKELAALQQTDPQCFADIMGFAAPRADEIDSPGFKLGVQLCPLARRIHDVLDPGGKHLNAGGTGTVPLPTDLLSSYSARGTQILTIENQVTWTSDGKPAVLPGPAAKPAHDPLFVQVVAQAPGRGVLYREHFVDHRGIVPSATDPGTEYVDTTPWGPATVTTLSDGSTVSVHKEQDAKGESIEAVRTFKSGVQLFIYIDAATGAGGAKQFPFTEAQVATALSVPAADDIRLPAPSR